LQPLWAPKTEDWPLMGGIVIALAGDEFYIGGAGLAVTFKSTN
jgi:hypothetical protein